MSNIYVNIGQKIRELRGTLSQDALAKKIGKPSNTLSRWETGTYKPTAEDLDKLARFFNVPITVFFPDQINTAERVSALTSATGGLDAKDFEEVVRYAEYRKAQQILKKSKKR
jgi:transcriptional regulator with XRE-family HTH domain